MGTSYVLQKGRAISTIVTESFAVSMRLGLKALIAAILIGVPLGCIAGLFKGKAADGAIRGSQPSASQFRVMCWPPS